MKSKGRGIKQVRVSIGFLTELMRDGNSINMKCINGLPKDAEFAYWYTSPSSGHNRFMEVILVYISSEFLELNEGDLIPNMKPSFEKVGL